MNLKQFRYMIKDSLNDRKRESKVYNKTFRYRSIRKGYR